MKFLLSAYGLTIHSEIVLPELRPGEGVPDIVIRPGPVSIPPPGIPQGARRWIGGTSEDLLIWWSVFGTVGIRGGREVTVDALPGVDHRTLRSVLMGSVMGLLLLQRTPSVFHASAISMPNGAVAFMAHKRHGKSSTASALLVRGHDVISDDLAVLDDIGDFLMVRTGFKEMKLWPDTLEALGQAPDDLTRVMPSLEKRARPLGNRLAVEPVPLLAVYVLAYGPKMAIERLSPKDALFGVMPHWYGAQFQGELLPMLDPRDHFQAMRLLVDRVPVFRFSRPQDLKLLDAMARCIEGHVEVLAETKSQV